MIIEYVRPETIQQALQYLARQEVRTVPLAGGTVVNQPSFPPVAVVDLQSLGLNTLERRGKDLLVGATTSLQSLLEFQDLPSPLKRAIEHEATYNLRQIASIAGTLVSADGRSPLTTALLALDAQLNLLPGDEVFSLGDLLPVRAERLRGRLVTSIVLPLNAGFAYHFVARTPADLPIVCAAGASWPSGRTRIALGGFGTSPVLAMDGPEPGGAEVAARSAYDQAQDEWASAEYRREVAGTLARRCIEEISSA